MSDFGKRFIEYVERFTEIINNSVSDQMEKFSKSYASGAYMRKAAALCREFQKDAMDWADTVERLDRLREKDEETQFQMRYF